ncbi:MAG: hypothetical protein AB7P76_08425 [Candidatus Melainabacteria bacterium]
MQIFTTLSQPAFSGGRRTHRREHTRNIPRLDDTGGTLQWPPDEWVAERSTSDARLMFRNLRNNLRAGVLPEETILRHIQELTDDGQMTHERRSVLMVEAAGNARWHAGVLAALTDGRFNKNLVDTALERVGLRSPEGRKLLEAALSKKQAKRSR